MNPDAVVVITFESTVVVVPLDLVKIRGIHIAADTAIAIRRVIRNKQSFPQAPHLNVTHSFKEELFTFNLPFNT